MAVGRPRGRAVNPSGAKKAPLAYYRSAPPNQSSPFEKKKRPGRRIISGSIDLLVIVVILLAVTYSLIIRPQPKIILDSTAYHPISAYRQAAINSFKSFSNRNKLTFNERTIVADLKKQFPELAGVFVELPLIGETPLLRLDIAEPAFFLNSQGTDYVVDSEGVAVGTRADLTQFKALPMVIDQTGFSVQVGRQILGASEVSFISTVIVQSKKAKVRIASMTLPALAAEFDLREAGRSYFVKFYLGGDALVQSGQFLAARQQFAQDHHQPARYLDVRVPGKIYYR